MKDGLAHLILCLDSNKASGTLEQNISCKNDLKSYSCEIHVEVQYSAKVNIDLFIYLSCCCNIYLRRLASFSRELCFFLIHWWWWLFSFRFGLNSFQGRFLENCVQRNDEHKGEADESAQWGRDKVLGVSLDGAGGGRLAESKLWL